MKKFLIKLIIFLFIIGTPLLLLNYKYKHTNFYLQMNELYWLKVHPDDIELLNLGNSHEMFGIRMFDKYMGVSHNFATSSQPFYYDYQVLDNLSDSIEENAIVLIPISLFDWYYNYPELFKEDTASFNKRYYSLLPASHILYYNLDDDIKYNYLSVLTAKDNLKYIVKDIDLPRREDGVATKNPNAVKNNAQWKYDSWTNYVMKYTDEVKTENVKWSKKIIDLCYNKGYRPVVISTPIPYTLSEKFSDEFLEEFKETNRKILSDYPDILFLDHSEDKTYTHNLEYYKDADHMNIYGADAYSWELLNELVEYGYISREQLY